MMNTFLVLLRSTGMLPRKLQSRRYSSFSFKSQQTPHLINRPDGLIICPLRQDYIDYVRKLVEKYPEHGPQNSVIAAAHGKEAGFSYSLPSLSSSPVAADNKAAILDGGSSTSTTTSPFSSAGLFGGRTGRGHCGCLYKHFNSKHGQNSE